MVYLPAILMDIGTLLALLSIAGAVAVVCGFRRTALGLLGIVSMSFLALFLLPVGAWMNAPLEKAFAHQPPLGDDALVDGVVVLGGATRPAMSKHTEILGLAESAERHVAFVGLARRFPDARLVVSGYREAPAPRWIMASAGLNPDRIEVEDRSRTTAENITEILRTIRPACGERWILITSAAHMPRAIALTQSNGWPVIPWPVDYQSIGAKPAFVPRKISDSLSAAASAGHEWIGLLAYRMLGKTDRLWPAPLGSEPCRLPR